MKQETLILPAGTWYCWNRSVSEIEEIKLRDIRDGRTLDDAGEPRIYYATSTAFLDEDTVVTITRKSVKEWDSWRRKPPRLTEGLATIEGLPKLIMFSRSAQICKQKGTLRGKN